MSPNLLFASESDLRQEIERSINNIKTFAKKNSPLYRATDIFGIVSKKNLQKKNLWYCPGVNSRQMATSGSTGEPFHYLASADTFFLIENDFHYKMILEEFDLTSSNVLSLFLTVNVDTPCCVAPTLSTNPLHTHGSTGETHLGYRNSLYYSSQEKYYLEVIDYLLSHKIDVILSSGQIINSLKHYVQKLGIKDKLCTLVSNTCSSLMLDDVKFLVKNGNISCWCDHMRCWDGGASFFTCKYGTYHLMDNLAYCWSSSGKLISTDYYSFPSPFINYWNGDYSVIGNKYERCLCGRLYRDFNLRATRPFFVNDISSHDIKVLIKRTKVKGIKFVKCCGIAIDITTSRTLSEEEKEALKKALPSFKMSFWLEN